MRPRRGQQVRDGAVGGSDSPNASGESEWRRRRLRTWNSCRASWIKHQLRRHDDARHDRLPRRVLTVCSISGDACEAISHDGQPVAGTDPKWSNDEATIFFLRTTPNRGLRHELWAIDDDGSNERKLFDVGPIAATDVDFAVARDGQIVWAKVDRGQSELWTAKLE
jgi:hypothetical protein